MVAAYPLSWPEGFPRAKSRETGKFKTALPAALKNAHGSLRLFGTDSGREVSNIILSSNVSLGEERPADPGVAAWFLWDGEQRCIPIDRYQTVAANVQAIHHIIEARRVELRHGSLSLVRASFKGFTTALPAPGGRPRPWREVLGFNAERPGVITRERIEGAYRLKAKSCHPDIPGGSSAAMAELNAARDAALKEIG